ncbi:DUF333 domain-containing protein [Microbulbifer agarilyticus]|uniref:putative hemolysin n=1 Tax=Microbulbifer agarilyticus TaxID=260552 RepID=UPI001C95C034|nr:DUF333 domain-containing protein [Microbulbifer agarilyticus]MBY6191405.1 DUF333 domain-containing protein [Microbulbifer agarilyticus]
MRPTLIPTTPKVRRVLINTVLYPILLVAALPLLNACSERQDNDGKAILDQSNPAAEHCAKIGGKPGTYTQPSGDQVSTCTMPDGRECDAWKLMRDEQCQVIERQNP